MYSESGSGRLGCLVTLLLIVIFGYFTHEVLPVYYDKWVFEDDLARITSRAGAGAWTDSMIERRILDLAYSRHFEVHSEALRVRRSGTLDGTPELRVEVVFSRTIKFPWYEHTFHFSTRSESFVGSF